MNYQFQLESTTKVCSVAIIAGPPGSSTLPKNEIYMKLDIIGVKYIKEYKEKSSQEFKKMVGNIKQEVSSTALVDCIFYWVKSKNS